MRGVEQIIKVAKDVVGVGAYQRARKKYGAEALRRPLSAPLGTRLGAGTLGVTQVALPFFGRWMENMGAIPPNKMSGVFVALASAADLGVYTFMLVLASMGKPAEAVALKTAHSAGVHVIYDAMEHRARHPNNSMPAHNQ